MTAALSLAPVVACQSQPLHGPVPQLGHTWSGDSTPVCVKQSTGGELVDGQVDPWRCKWNLPQSSVADSLWGLIDEPSRASMVVWQRGFTSRDAAARFVDSLEMEMKSRGLARRECQGGAVPAGQTREVRWDGGGLTVFLTHIMAGTAAQRVLLFAVDDPEQVPPPFACS